MVLSVTLFNIYFLNSKDEHQNNCMLDSVTIPVIIQFNKSKK